MPPEPRVRFSFSVSYFNKVFEIELIIKGGV